MFSFCLPLFTSGEPDRAEGLELLAETGNPSELGDSFEDELPAGSSFYGLFDTPVDATDPGPIPPGGAFDIDFEAMPGDRLSLATMYGLSNDWIFAFDPEGIALFDSGGLPVTGDVTAEISLWDVGTELSEEPAVGTHLGAPEGDPDTDTTVRTVGTSVYETPADQHIQVVLSTR